MQIYYTKPLIDPEWICIECVDKDGHVFWYDSREWNPIVIDKKGRKNLLPREISEFIPKWQDDLKLAKEQNAYPGYPIKLVKITFIYNNQVYKITPELFSEEYNTRYYFYGAHEKIEKDLQNLGCIYTKYSDELD